jgi:hypothetical protein
VHSFNKLIGACNDEVLPEFVNVYVLPFSLEKRKDGAAILDKNYITWVCCQRMLHSLLLPVAKHCGGRAQRREKG